ncbi:MAG TPA: EamA family transporter [Solirubrobacteraceae bacterium]|nr:EamA family transporter [Solirubrobacteraceae bacterium]
MSRHTTGALLIAACALTWGFIGIVVREIDLPALAIVFFRVLLSASFIALLLAIARRRDLLRRPPGAVLWLGVLLAIHWGLYFAAIKETSVASAVLITYAAPIFMAMLAPVLIREHVPRSSVAALGVSMAGIAAISLSGGSGGEEVRIVGAVLALGAAITYALLIVFLKRWAANVHPMTLVAWQEGTAAVVLSPALLFTSFGGVSGSDVAYLAILGVALTGLSGVIYVGALKWVPATTAGILAYMEPVSAAVLAALLLDESLTLAIVVGGGAIVAAGVVVALQTPPDSGGGTVEEPVAVPALPEPATTRSR